MTLIRIRALPTSMQCAREGVHASALGLATAVLLAASPLHADGVDAYLFGDQSDVGTTIEAGLPEAPDRYWLEDPEFRFVPDRNTDNVSTETYRLRFRPTSSRERTADRAMYGIESEIVTARLRKSASQAMAGRYHRLLELIEVQLDADLIRKRLQLDRDQLRSEDALAASSDFSAARLGNATARLGQHEQALERSNARARALRQTTQLTDPGVRELHEAPLAQWLLQPAAIGAQLTELVAKASSDAFDSVVPRLEAQRAQHRLAEEKGRTGLGLSLLELGYQDDRVESYTLTFGFRIPLAQRPNTRARLQRDLFEAQQLAQLAERELAERLRFAVMQMQLQVDAHAQDAAALAALRSDAAGLPADAAILAALRTRQLELSASMTRTHIQLLHDLVDLLAETGQLDRAPLRNWLRSEA